MITRKHRTTNKQSLYSHTHCIFATPFVITKSRARAIRAHSKWTGCMVSGIAAALHPHNVTLNTALPWVLSNTPAKCEVDRMNGFLEDLMTYKTSIHTETPSMIVG